MANSICKNFTATSSSCLSHNLMTCGALILSLGGMGKCLFLLSYVVECLNHLHSQVPELSEWSISLQKSIRYSNSEDDEHELNEILCKRAARIQRSNNDNPRGGTVLNPSAGESNPRATETSNGGDDTSRSSSLTPSVQSVDLPRLTDTVVNHHEGQTSDNGGDNRASAKKRGKGGGRRGRGKGARGRGGKVTR